MMSTQMDYLYFPVRTISPLAVQVHNVIMYMEADLLSSVIPAVALQRLSSNVIEPIGLSPVEHVH